MSLKDHAVFSSLLFLIIFIAHSVRLFYGWEVVVGSWVVPQGLSWIAVLVSGYFAYTGLTAGGFQLGDIFSSKKRR